jgi:hypothetical protein
VVTACAAPLEGGPAVCPHQLAPRLEPHSHLAAVGIVLGAGSGNASPLNAVATLRLLEERFCEVAATDGAATMCWCSSSLKLPGTITVQLCTRHLSVCTRHASVCTRHSECASTR